MNNIICMDIEKLAQWYNEINNWKWPKELESIKPSNYDNLPDFHNKLEDKYSHGHQIMSFIELLIGRKECLRYHWLHNLYRTNEQFEEWYEIGGEEFMKKHPDLYGR